MRTSITGLLFFLISAQLFSQLGIGTSTPDPSAILELQSTDQGFLLPRLNTLQQQNIVDPATGLMVFNTDSSKVYFFNGNVWLTFRNITDTLRHWSCGDQLLDYRDLKVYSTIQIGSQCWMAENLNVGTLIPYNQNMQNNGIIEKYCFGYDESYCITYGGIYQWNEAMQYTEIMGTQGICPAGWHIPSIYEWVNLVDYLGGESAAGGKMKATGTLEAGTGLWASPNTGATNESGFSVIPDFNGYHADIWSSNMEGSIAARLIWLKWNSTTAETSFDSKTAKFYIRCIKN